MNRSKETIAMDVLGCASSHEQESRLLGNVQASELAAITIDYLVLRAAAREVVRAAESAVIRDSGLRAAVDGVVKAVADWPLKLDL
jgi:hypothetical protein